MRAGARKQAHVPVGRGRAGAGGDRAGVPRRLRRRWSPCCRGRRASCRRCGRRRSRSSRWRALLASRGGAGAADPAVLPAARAADRGDAARAGRGRAAAGGHHLPAPRRARGGDGVRAVGGRRRTRRSRRRCASATATSCSPTTARRSTRSSRGCSSGLTVATAESCTGGLMAGRLTDLRRLLGVRAGRARRVLERGQDGVGGRARGADRGARRRLAGGGARRWRRARGRASAPTSGSGSPASPGRAAGRRRSRSAPSACASRRPTTSRSARCGCPAVAPRRARPHDHGRAAHAPCAAAAGLTRCTPPTATTRPRSGSGLPERRAAALRRARPPRRASATPLPRRAPIDRASGARSSREALHVTLAFLGSAPADRRRPDRAADRADAGARRPPSRSRAAAPAPPRPGPHRGARGPHGALAQLQARISAGLEAAGVYTPEKRPFRPHVTIARLRPRVRPPRAADARARAARVPGTRRHALRLAPAPVRRPLRAAGNRAAGDT